LAPLQDALEKFATSGNTFRFIQWHSKVKRNVSSSKHHFDGTNSAISSVIDIVARQNNAVEIKKDGDPLHSVLELITRHEQKLQADSNGGDQKSHTLKQLTRFNLSGTRNSSDDYIFCRKHWYYKKSR
jgi:hypothetical protein